MFKDKELIIFDMDGTLIDSVPSLSYAINYMLKELGRKTFDENIIRDWVGNGADILVKRALVGKKEYEDENIDEEYFKKAKEIFLEFYGKNLNAKTTLYPDVIDTLEYLKSKGYKLALATNKPIEFVGSMLEHFGLLDYFETYLGGGSLKYKKPHPQILLKICNDLNIPPLKSVMVGDSKSDILAAKSANMDVIALTYGYNQGLNLEELEPTILLDNFRDLKEYF